MGYPYDNPLAEQAVLASLCPPLNWGCRMSAQAPADVEQIERMLWLWSLEAAGRVGPDAASVLARISQRSPVR